MGSTEASVKENHAQSEPPGHILQDGKFYVRYFFNHSFKNWKYDVVFELCVDSDVLIKDIP